jgi:hypothetical protein
VLCIAVLFVHFVFFFLSKIKGKIFMQYTTVKDGSAVGVTHSRSGMLGHCRALTVACNYTEGQFVGFCLYCLQREYTKGDVDLFELSNSQISTQK